MDQMFSHPAVQSALIPFLSAAIGILALRKFKPLWPGLVGVLAFSLTVSLTSGLEFFPLNSTRKIILVTYGLALLGLLADTQSERLKSKPWLFSLVLSFLVSFCYVWVLWPVLSRGTDFLSLLNLLFITWMIFSIHRFYEELEKHAIAIIALGIGTAIVCIQGASALYGQLATPLAVVVAVWYVYSLFGLAGDKLPYVLYLPASCLPLLLAASSTVYASLPAWSIAILGLLPLAFLVPVKKDFNPWLKSIVRFAYAMLPIGIAIAYLLMSTAQEESYYG